ncbi:MAG: DNA translocase FtsK [Bryobacteraceae bacterium]
MNILGPTRHHRLNEAAAVVFLLAGFFVLFSLASYYPQDPSWNTAGSALQPNNLSGRVGAIFADLALQGFGLAGYGIPLLLFVVSWKWLRSSEISAPWIKIAGAALLLFSVCAGLALLPSWRPVGGVIPAGGIAGILLADYLTGSFNTTGASLVTAACLIVGVYLVSRFSMAILAGWLAGPMAVFGRMFAGWKQWRERRAEIAIERAKTRAARRALARAQAEEDDENPLRRRGQFPAMTMAAAAGAGSGAGYSSQGIPTPEALAVPEPAVPRGRRQPIPSPVQDFNEIPIHTLELYTPPAPTESAPWDEPTAPHLVTGQDEPASRRTPSVSKRRISFRLPGTALLNEPSARLAYDSQELKETAAAIKAKFEEFNVRGTVTQINPGPVVTTFEFKPEAGVKLSRITALSEDLSLGLQAESVLIERIPGKPTVGIEVPNTKREVISLRQILESEEFNSSTSALTMALGKDISGRIRVTSLETMPHLLIAGSTGSGKSVMVNSMIMSVLYKSTPQQVRMILVDPKRVEFGLYEGVPHLLTPVITDAKKATNALRNAVLEMERRLKLLASLGVRNIDQFNKKVKLLKEKPRSLFEEGTAEEEELEHLPYIMIVIDELADLMTLERANVEESVMRLAQMARAVGMHLMLATQRPSVDVVTGLIKANLPSRISFRLRTRVDSRTVLDAMGAEHLLGQGDMLFLPPGSSRLIRVHGPYVSETEIADVVNFWKEQAQPEYDQTFLLAPPSADDNDPEIEEFDGDQDPMYQDAVKCVLEMGKASTSTLQRRLRLGYGRAARILDMMQREGIIGPPDGSRPREVLKRPDWLAEVESQMR